MTDFATMSIEERNAFHDKLAPIISESGLEGIELKMTRETVCPVADNAV